MNLRINTAQLRFLIDVDSTTQKKRSEKQKQSPLVLVTFELFRSLLHSVPASSARGVGMRLLSCWPPLYSKPAGTSHTALITCGVGDSPTLEHPKGKGNSNHMTNSRGNQGQLRLKMTKTYKETSWTLTKTKIIMLIKQKHQVRKKTKSFHFEMTGV